VFFLYCCIVIKPRRKGFGVGRELKLSQLLVENLVVCVVINLNGHLIASPERIETVL
jgi:hypothetical protein